VAALLELDHVAKAFGTVVVADDLSYTLEAGEILGVVGPNGAGKTSMLNLITGILPVDGGRILLDGRDITAMPAHARARAGIGRTHQVPRPFGGMTVFENVLIGASFAGARTGTEPRAASVAALERTGLLSHANTPAGALTLLDRKRLELARALAIGPRVLLLDEIAGGLTELEVQALIATIRSLRGEGLGIVWIEHIVQALVSVVDRLMATNYGRKLAEGPPGAVMASPEVRSVYLGHGLSA
jgi:branched-chain amino acid transport system ATP-binding protein